MKLLLPVDGSDVSLEAVRFAIRLARSGLETSVTLWPSTTDSNPVSIG